jgi:regulator of sigma E protease
MINLLQTLLAFVFALGVLVTFHEFGHYWVARRLGVKILRFCVGFGRPVWTRRAGADQTEFAIAAIPLGGYVKMLDEREGEVDPNQLHRAFNRQSLAVRAAIVSAGPIANFLLALLVYWASYMAGVVGPKPILGEVTADGIAYRAGLRSGDEILAVDGKPTAIWDNVLNSAVDAILDRGVVELRVRAVDHAERTLRLDLSRVSVDDLSRGDFFAKLGFEPARLKIPPRIGKVLAGEAAAAAGLEVGDLVTAVDDRPIDDWMQWVKLIRDNPGNSLQVTVQRGADTRSLTLVPRSASADGKRVGRIGAEVAPPPPGPGLATATERYTPWSAAHRALQRTGEVTTTTLKFLRQMLQGQASLENLSGPLSIAQYAGESAKQGASRFLEFLGLVSVSLAVLNLLPIPLLDGGHLVYYLIEFVLRRPVPEGIQFYGQQIGLVLLLGLMGLALYNDLMRIF